MITLIVSSTITRLTARKTRDNDALEATCPSCAFWLPQRLTEAATLRTTPVHSEPGWLDCKQGGIAGDRLVCATINPGELYRWLIAEAGGS